MKRIILTLAAFALAGSVAWAADPAKVMDSSLGKIWTDQKGMTLYTFDKDEANKTNCYDKCAEAWPPFMVAEGGVAEGKWTIVERTDGGKMWAYDGHPLYLWVKDTKPGDVTGDMVGNVWHVAKAP